MIGKHELTTIGHSNKVVLMKLCPKNNNIPLLPGVSLVELGEIQHMGEMVDNQLHVVPAHKFVIKKQLSY